MKMTEKNAFFIAILFASSTGILSAQENHDEQPTLRPYILKAINNIALKRSNGPYDAGRSFSQDLRYADGCCVTASKPLLKIPGPNPTMCVAAVAEIMIEALNIYGTEKNDWSFKKQLPMKSWNSGQLKYIRAHVFRFKGSASYGTADALARFGLGKHLEFSALKPGDFVNFNRNDGKGHAVVFLGYLVADKSDPVLAFSPDIVGFRYFSAQGKTRPDGGFGYRNAYFDGKCPQPKGQDSDCGVLKRFTVNESGVAKTDQKYLNSGEMFLPKDWTTQNAFAELRSSVSRGIATTNISGPELTTAINQALDRELQPDITLYEDGSD